MTKQYSLSEASLLLGVKPYRIQYALFVGLIPEPARVGQRRAFTDNDLSMLAKHFKLTETKIDDGSQNKIMASDD